MGFSHPGRKAREVGLDRWIDCSDLGDPPKFDCHPEKESVFLRGNVGCNARRGLGEDSISGCSRPFVSTGRSAGISEGTPVAGVLGIILEIE